MKIGIYKILNLKDKKSYIGSTSTIGFEKRWNKHVLDLNNDKHHSIYLQRAWNKYGKSNFDFIIVEECEKENCLKREQYYIDKMEPEYNICKNAGSTLGIKLNENYCKRLKMIRKGKSNPFYGKHHTEKTKNILRIKCLNEGKENGMYGKGYKLEGNKNGSFKGNYVFFNKNIGKVICPQYELIEKYNLDVGSISRVCNNRRKSHKDWTCLGKK